MKSTRWFQRKPGSEEINDRSSIANSLINFGWVYLRKKYDPLALKYSQRGKAISVEIGYPINVQNSAKVLSQIYKKMGKYKESLENYQLYIRMRDSLKIKIPGEQPLNLNFSINLKNAPPLIV